MKLAACCALCTIGLATYAMTQTAPTYTDGGDGLRMVTHAENLPAGFPMNGQPLELRNPHEGDKQAVEVGKQLFIAYNCIDCHGADGSGAMGPTVGMNSSVVPA